MKKSIISAILVFVFVLMMAACGSTDTKVNSNYVESGKQTKPQHPVCVVTNTTFSNAFKAMVRGRAQLVEMLRFKVQAMIDEKYPKLKELNKLDDSLPPSLKKEEKEILLLREHEFRKEIEERIHEFKEEKVSKQEVVKEQEEQQPVAENEKKVSEDEIRSKVEEEFNRDKGFLADDTESSDDHKDEYIDYINIARYVAEHSASGLETMEKWGDNILMCVELEKFEESADAYLKQIKMLTDEIGREESLLIDYPANNFEKKNFDEKIRDAFEAHKESQEFKKFEPEKTEEK